MIRGGLKTSDKRFHLVCISIKAKSIKTKELIEIYTIYYV